MKDRMNSKQLTTVFSAKVLIGLLAFILMSADLAAADGDPSAPISKPKVSSVSTKGKLGEFELGKYQYCGSDRDCTVANNGCCDCANGGEDVAINVAQVAEFKARFDCLSQMCTERGAEPPCGSGVVTCLNHKCRYVAPKAEGEFPR